MGFLKRDAKGSRIHIPVPSLLLIAVTGTNQKEHVHMVYRQCIESVMACEGFISLGKQLFLKTNIVCTWLEEGSGIMSGNWKQRHIYHVGFTRNLKWWQVFCLFPQQGTGSRAWTRSSITAWCHLVNPLLGRALIDTIHPISRFWEADSLPSNIASIAISASQWLKAGVCRQVWYFAPFLVVLFFYTIASRNHFTP